GIFGGAVNITDGRYTYFLYPEDMTTQEIYEYTLMPTHQRSFFDPDALRQAELTKPFGFTDGMPLMKMPARRASDGRVNVQGLYEDTTTVLYDIKTDPDQNTPIDDLTTIARLQKLMARLMHRNEAPQEAYRRIGLQDYA
ncbi:MAG: sulfatase, partial [Alphaproteobacteria bacterium]